MNILGTGLSGLVGSRVIELLTPEYSFQDLSLETGVDITRKEVVDQAIDQSSAPWVFHFAAITDVDGAERERGIGAKSNTWRVNVEATEHIVTACLRRNKHILYISTDYVFDGLSDSYTEKDQPHPQSWYAITKYEGEKRVMSLHTHGLVVRIANPYRATYAMKKDFVHKILERLDDGGHVYAPIDQLFVPTFIDDIAMAIKLLVDKHAFGVYHVVGSQALSPYAAAVKVATAFQRDTSLVREVQSEEYYKDKASRPLHAYLKNDKIAKLGLHMSTFDEGLAFIQKQVSRK